MNEKEPNTESSSSRIIGSGEMASLVRAYNWASTPLGPIESWSKELVTIVNLTLCSPSPARTMWGPEFILIYNDAYRPIPGPRHPFALGKPASEVYKESWPVVGPLLEKAFTTGETFYYEKLLVPLPTDHGVRDFYLNYSFNPIFENGEIAGLFGPLHDVTGEVTAVRQLRESEARSNRILQSIGDAVIVTDADAHVTGMNPIAERLTGWVPSEAQGRPLADVFNITNETTGELVESPAEKVKRTGTIVGLSNHTVLTSKDGTQTHIDDSSAPIRNDDGDFIGIVLVFRDINERRVAELERDTVTARLNQVLETTTDAIISVDRDWRISYCNANAVASVAPIEIYIGRPFWEAFPLANYEGSTYLEHYRRAMDDGIASQFDAHYSDPLNIWVQVHVRPSPDGIVIFFRDVSQQRADQESLRLKNEEAERQRSEIETVYRTAPIGLALFDTKDFRYLRLNDRQAAFFGLKPEQIVGRTLTEMAPIEGLRELFEQVAHGEPVINYPLEGALATDPEHRYWNVSYFPVYAADGSIQAITAASLEVTAQRKTEAALIQSEKLAVVGRLASSIAHEINNPLEAVTNLLYLAQTSSDIVEIKDFLDTAERELRRVSAIANQTLRFHKQASSPQAITASAIFDSVLSVYQGRTINAGVRIDRRDRATTPIYCFEGEIRQVVSNLFSNALDAMTRNPGRLFLRSREATHWRSGEKGIVFTVADNGTGISPETLTRIFKPFFTTKSIMGTGLGLWVSNEIVGRHKGVLRVRSSSDPRHHGSVFTLFLPFKAVTRGEN